MEIKLSLKPSKDWMGQVAEQFGVEAKSASEFYHSEGHSYVKLNATIFDREVAVLIGDLCWHKPLNTVNLSLGTNEYWTLQFVHSEDAHTHYLTGGAAQKHTQAFKSSLFFSSKMTVNTYWAVGKRSRFVAISFSRDWLYEKLGLSETKNNETNSAFLNLLSSEAGVYMKGMALFEQSLSLNKLFEDVHTPTWKLSAQAKCYQLIADFIDQIGYTTIEELGMKLNQSDLKRIVAIENKYFVATKPLPNLDFLASEAHMSLSKFKKCFKQVYGLPPYEYHLNQKLELAKNQLLQNKWTVSKIASQLGYTSAANFDKAFKKKFAMSPTSMLKKV